MLLGRHLSRYLGERFRGNCGYLIAHQPAGNGKGKFIPLVAAIVLVTVFLGVLDGHIEQKLYNAAPLILAQERRFSRNGFNGLLVCYEYQPVF